MQTTGPVEDEVSLTMDIVEPEEENMFLGSGEYSLVGIRYYTGVAHPGEYVTLVREPRNPYDRNAIRVDNLHGEKVGHVKGTSAQVLAPLMDSRNSNNFRIDASIPRKGNKFTLPLLLEFYSVIPSSTNNNNIDGEADRIREASAKVANVLAKGLKRDYIFRLSREFGGASDPQEASSSASAPASASASASVTVQRKKMDWQQQERELDVMFDKQLEEQMKHLPKISMPDHLFKDIELFDYQVQGIKWLVKQETCNKKPLPFYKQVKEAGRMKYLCEITNCSQTEPPKQMKGSILCDEMGLGKTVQTLGLILLAPPQGVHYDVAKKCPQDPSGNGGVAEGVVKEIIPVPSEFTIRQSKVPLLKDILKTAKLKVSGKKNDLIERVLNGVADGDITGEHFPVSMRPVESSKNDSDNNNYNRCTLVVCPVSVMSNWQHQIKQYIHDDVLNLKFYHGPNRYEILPEIHAGRVDIALVSYHTLANEYGSIYGKGDTVCEEPQKKKSKKTSIFDIDFHRIILDEAHTIRSDKTKFFKAVKHINSDRKLALTGTPFVNRSDDVHSLLSFLGAEPLSDKAIFRRAISQPIKNGEELGLARLRTCMGCVSLRRSKALVNVKLVEKDVQLCAVEFPDDAHKMVYDALFGSIRYAMEAILSEENGTTALKSYTSIFEKMLRMRQSCCSATLVAPERREAALKIWKDIQGQTDGTKKLTPEEGLALLEKLKGAFAEEDDKLPECGVCLVEMEEQDSTILKSCSHVFCKLCIRQVLLKSGQKCPYCRHPFTQDDIIDRCVATKAASKQKEDDQGDQISGGFGTAPKVLALLGAIKNMQPDEKGVIFSQFTGFLDIIEDGLRDAGHSFTRIDGSVSASRRSERIQAFNSDEAGSPRFILCSLLAAGTGINLTRGNHCFMLDCWWNSSVENQAMDRIHRLDQKRKVNVLRFVMKDSIEERIIGLQEAKGLQAKGVLEKLKGDEKRKALLSDLRVLFSLDRTKTE